MFEMRGTVVKLPGAFCDKCNTTIYASKSDPVLGSFVWFCPKCRSFGVSFGMLEEDEEKACKSESKSASIPKEEIDYLEKSVSDLMDELGVPKQEDVSDKVFENFLYATTNSNPDIFEINMTQGVADGIKRFGIMGEGQEDGPIANQVGEE